ncbi:respiratory chain complex I subunit 1 family protein [Propionispira raffinosivorans]|uniref:respiratory chain complex I subunit 1 family protein n=1 Tax=Propionispira raffinosivorans TaxID=86959 RepID=UPI000377894E|nr:NADH-quinone oxidoreductase subunit H [Propionispira raffinosivorans]
MIEKIVYMVCQVLLVLFAAPLVEGIIKKVKARLQNRIGADLIQPYRDLFKYLRKDAVLAKEASWLTRTTPYLVFAIVLGSVSLLPMAALYSSLTFTGDIILLVYLFAVVRFFLAITALDSGSAFGGMGSSREMIMSAICEAALLLAVIAVLMQVGTTNLRVIVESLLTGGRDLFNYAYWLSFVAFLLVVIVETGRIPYDNPDTHLELTMIHEAMLLEYSGRYWGLLHWALLVKQILVFTLFIDLFIPWGIAKEFTGLAIFEGSIFYLLKVILLGILLAVIETVYAKMRLFKVPKLLAVSMALSVLAIVLQIAV